MSDRIPLYRQVADRIEGFINDGVYEPGERLPSIRELHAEFGVSINTAREVFRVLEARGVVEARRHAGHFVRMGPPVCDECDMDYPGVDQAVPLEVTPNDLTLRVLEDAAREGWFNLVTLEPPVDLLPTRRLTELTVRALRRRTAEAVGYSIAPGPLELRQEIAKRVVRGGLSVSAEHVLVTAGCLEAVFVSLATVCSPGDAVVLESPGFFLFYRLLETLHLKAIEVPSRPAEGVDPDALEHVLRSHARPGTGRPRITAALLLANFTNPIGALMSDEAKRSVATLLDRHGVYLIEDDMYGEMAWSVSRPVSMAAFADPERTLVCASFSKSIAPGYRIGWVTGGRRLVARATATKLVTSSAVSGPAALGIAEFLAHGAYDRWLRSAQRHYREIVPRVRNTVADSFPSGTRSTLPAGGMVLWVVMPPGVDAVDLYNRTRLDRIAFSPGPIFSLTGSFRTCLRLNASIWSPEAERAIRTIGRHARELAEAGQSSARRGA